MRDRSRNRHNSRIALRFAALQRSLHGGLRPPLYKPAAHDDNTHHVLPGLTTEHSDMSVWRRYVLCALACVTQAASGVAQPAVPSAAACNQTVERFIEKLDIVMARRPTDIGSYYATVPLYSTYSPSTSPARERVPDPSVANCDPAQVIEIAKRSKFFYEAGGPPLYAAHRVEFRNSVAKVYFSIDRDTGRLQGAGAFWIRPFL